MSERRINEVAKTLMKARELISDPLHWVQGTYCTSIGGHKMYCAAGAIYHALDVAADGPIPESGKLFLLMDQTFSALMVDQHSVDVEGYNDNHTHDEVLALFDKAIAREIVRENALCQ